MHFHRRNFAPRNRGDIATALSTPKALTVIAPESPRPLELLQGVTFDKDSTLTADDAALHELLVTVALDTDIALAEETHAVPMKQILRFLGTDARRDAIKESLGRLLRNTVSFGTYEQVPLLVSWISRTESEDMVHFSLPLPLRSVLTQKQEYAYIEVAALPGMRSKFVSRLYKALVAELKATGRRWIKGGDNQLVITATVEQVADWVCFPREKDGRVRGGKLKERVLDIAVAQFNDVQAFGLTINAEPAKTRGNPILEVRFELTLNPPSHHQNRVIYDASGIRQFGGVDAHEFRVRQDIWLKASGHFIASFPDLSHSVLFGLWTASLQEMLTEQPITDGYATRRYRGDRLRQEIAKRGADATAWAWAMEEADNPDLVLRSKSERQEIAVAGENARRERVWGDNAKPVETVAPVVVAEAVPVPEATSFADCSEIWLDLDDTLTIQTIDDMVLDHIDSYRDWRGGVQKTIKVRWWIRGNYNYHDFKLWSPSEDDIETLVRRIGSFIERVEYVA